MVTWTLEGEGGEVTILNKLGKFHNAFQIQGFVHEMNIFNV